MVVIAAGQQGFNGALHIAGGLPPGTAVGHAVFGFFLCAHPEYIGLVALLRVELNVLVLVHAEVDVGLVLRGVRVFGDAEHRGAVSILHIHFITDGHLNIVVILAVVAGVSIDTLCNVVAGISHEGAVIVLRVIIELNMLLYARPPVVRQVVLARHHPVGRRQVVVHAGA